jgi:hypothetical protein
VKSGRWAERAFHHLGWGKVGNPGTLLMTQGERTIDLVPRLRRSDPLRDRFPSPSGLGSRLAVGPPGLASMAIFAVSFLPQLAAGTSAAPTARRGGQDDKGESDASIESGCWTGAWRSGRSPFSLCLRVVQPPKRRKTVAPLSNRGHIPNLLKPYSILYLSAVVSKRTGQ